MNDLVTFSDEIDLKSLNDSQFIPLSIKCFSDGLTRHQYYFSLDSVKESSFSLCGKPLLWAYDIFTDDAAGHEITEIPCGFIPEKADIEYEYDETYEKTFVVVQGYIWDKYASNLVEILKRDNGVKDVSVELLLYQGSPDPKNPEIINAEKYCFTGVTILGEAITPAVDGAQATVLNFAEEKSEFEHAKEAFERTLLVNSAEKVKKVGEVKQMSKEKIVNSTDNAQQVDNATVIDTVKVSVKRDTTAYMDNGDAVYVEEKNEKETSVVTQVPDEEIIGETVETNSVAEKVDNATSEELDNACGEGDKENNAESDVKCAELTKKCQELQNSYDSLKAQFNALQVKCSDLEKYKKENEDKAYNTAVECALAEVSDYITDAEKNEWRETALKCSSISDFTNRLKAFAFDKKATKPQSFGGRSPLVTFAGSGDDSNSLWDKMEKSYH